MGLFNGLWHHNVSRAVCWNQVQAGMNYPGLLSKESPPHPEGAGLVPTERPHRVTEPHAMETATGWTRFLPCSNCSFPMPSLLRARFHGNCVVTGMGGV